MVQAASHAGQVASEPLGVAGVAEHPRLLQPVRLEQAALVEAAQLVGALGVPPGGHLEQPLGDGVGVRVERGQGGAQVAGPPVEPEGEGRVGGTHRVHSSVGP